MNQEPEPALQLPDHISKKLESLEQEIDQIVSYAELQVTAQLPDTIKFRFENSDSDPYPLPPYGMAQAISFITRYENLPDDYTVAIAHRNGKYYIHNFPFLRHVLNDFRPLIMNQSDSVYYRNIHSLSMTMLTRQDPSEGTILRVLGEEREDVTPAYVEWLG